MADLPVADCRHGAALPASLLNGDGTSVAYGTCHEADLGPGWQACASVPGAEPVTIAFQPMPAADQHPHGAFAMMA